MRQTCHLGGLRQLKTSPVMVNYGVQVVASTIVGEGASLAGRAPLLPQLMASIELDSLLWPSCRPQRDSAWNGHVSFAHWLVCASRPTTVVELGTHTGVSFAAFCNAVRRSKLSSKCFAVDTWGGDLHTGFYDSHVYFDLNTFIQANFADFATLLPCLFDGAVAKFADGTIDILHIDGLHTYEAVKHDFDTWLPKLSSRGIILFHDTDVRRGDFGVWKLWNEVSVRFPHFRFNHAFGLGVLAVGSDVAEPVVALCACEASEAGNAIRERFRTLSEFSYRNGFNELYNQEELTRSRTNIALGGKTSQSSEHPDVALSPISAVNGVRTGTFGFHTLLEQNPWWSVDLGDTRAFDLIVIYNRLDGPCQPRSRSLQVLVSDNATEWVLLYDHDGTVFGGIDGRPLIIKCPGTKARHVRIRLREKNFLHLDQVEIYGESIRR
jgi:hypothetical protein